MRACAFMLMAFVSGMVAVCAAIWAVLHQDREKFKERGW